jgi:hypothetical protein
VHRDATVAAQRDGDRKRYQFAGLFIEVPGLLAGPAQRGVALDDIGVELGEPANSGDELLPICIPIQQCMTLFSSMVPIMARTVDGPRSARHRQVLPHPQVIVGAPYRDLACPAGMTTCGAGEGSCLALQIGKYAIASFPAKLLELTAEISFVVHG